MLDDSSGRGSWVLQAIATVTVAFAPFLLVFGLPKLVKLLGLALGWMLRKKTDGRRSLLLSLMTEESQKFEQRKSADLSAAGPGGKDQKKPEVSDVGALNSLGIEGDGEWDGVVGFFHPFW